MSAGTNNFDRRQITPSQVTLGNLDTGDAVQPYNYLEWSARSTSIKPDQLFSAYNQYIRNWYDRRAANNAIPSTSVIKQQYVDLLKQLTLTNISAADKQFLSNLDFTNDVDLSIAVPYFARQLKQIALYLASKRETAKATKLKYSMAGTSHAIEKVLYQYILTAFTKKNNTTLIFDREFYDSLPSLSAVNGYLGIKVEELYDESNYFDSDITQPASAYAVPDDLSFAATGLTPDVVQMLSNIRNYSLSAVDIQAKYLGLTQYAVSANDVGDVTETVAISPETPHMHLDNRYYGTVAAIPNISTTKTHAELGGYFTYKNLGVSTYLAATKDYTYDVENMTPGQLYQIPDPRYINHGRSLTKTKQVDVVVHRENLDWIKSTNTNSYNDGRIEHAYDVQKFIPYQSKFETVGVDTQGTTRTSDRFDFWAGDAKDIWSDQFGHPLNWRGEFDSEARTDTLQITDLRTFNWTTDIFGNQYALYKSFDDNEFGQAGVYEKRLRFGELWVRLVDGRVFRAPDALANIYTKYAPINGQIYTALQNNVIRSFDVVYNTFVFEVDGYMIIQEFQYDYDAKEIVPGIGRIITALPSTESYGGFWFNEIENTLVFCILRNASESPETLDYGFITDAAVVFLDYGDLNFAAETLDYGNVSQLNLIYPELHKADLGMNNLVQMFPPVGTVPTELTVESSLFITDHERPVITFNQDTKMYNVAFLTMDALDGIYLFSIDLTETSKYVCTAGDPFVHVLSVPENAVVLGSVTFTSEYAGSTLQFIARSTTGYITVTDWDGNVTTHGDGDANNEITVSLAVDIGSQGVPKNITAQSVNEDGDPTGDIKSLYIPWLNVTNCDFSRCTVMTLLHAYQNQLTSINVNTLQYLQEFDVANNTLTAINVGSNPALEYFNCSGNPISAVDVTGNLNLELLQCSDTDISSLVVINNTQLQELYCSGNNISTLNVANNGELIIFYCGSCELSAIDVTNNPLLETFHCDGNEISTLDLSNNPQLYELHCEDNNLVVLDLRNNPLISNLACTGNPLTSLLLP